MPCDTPDTIPFESTVATAALLLAQLPLIVLSDKVVVLAAQIVVVPLIDDAGVFTVIMVESFVVPHALVTE